MRIRRTHSMLRTVHSHVPRCGTGPPRRIIITERTSRRPHSLRTFRAFVSIIGAPRTRARTVELATHASLAAIELGRREFDVLGELLRNQLYEAKRRRRGWTQNDLMDGRLHVQMSKNRRTCALEEATAYEN